MASLKTDLGRHPFQATVPPGTRSNGLHAVENLKDWNSPEKPQVEAWCSRWDTHTNRVYTPHYLRLHRT
ncbi:hypothetical protein DFJ58DRAFT_729106 [Suillus subalutaceus]|uniref:uncharacterized protein n=1 Tax=Suillus subalutaceus TaxID=48586 RepID=UPI001B861C09|nr:uncharacterized protein DFJ58DRAFT_729106 [Suillus subalutaceus]KAG1850812.1 hypothetical protein DFJ58DRAFT_729106 [Suillus subalutaceus]